MRVLNFNQIENLIKNNGYKSAIIYQGHIDDRDINAFPRFERIVAENPAAIALRLKELKEMLGGDYTLLFGNGLDNQRVNKMVRVKARFASETIPLNGNLEPHQPVDRDEIIKEVRAQIAAEIREQKKIEEVDELKRELAEMKTSGGKAAFAVNQLIQMFMPGMAPTPTMNGADVQNNQNEQVDRKVMNEALGVLVSSLGEQTIIKLAAKIKSNVQVMGQPIATVVKNFANS